MLISSLVACCQSPSDTLLLPPGPKPRNGWPAVLLLHDHGARFEKGWRKVIGNNPEPYYSGMAIGDSLAAHGYVVYCADALYWGSRGSMLSQRQFSDSLGTGQWYARILADDKAGIDTLCALPYVDTSRIAVAGFSYGAFRAWNLAAEDKRIHCCLAAHWMTTLARNRYNDSWQCMYRPGIYPLDKNDFANGSAAGKVFHSFAEVAAGIAPRPFLLQYGLQDHLFPVAAVDSCVQYLDSVYHSRAKDEDCFQAEAYACKHVFTTAHLKKWLLFLQNHL